MAPPGDDLERRSNGDLERPPMAWLPIVIVGGLALFGAWSLFSFVLGTVMTLVKLGVIVAVVGAVGWVLLKGYRGPPSD